MLDQPDGGLEWKVVSQGRFDPSYAVTLTCDKKKGRLLIIRIVLKHRLLTPRQARWLFLLCWWTVYFFGVECWVIDALNCFLKPNNLYSVFNNLMV